MILRSPPGLAEALDPGVQVVELMLTTGCNFRCAYCDQKRGVARTMPVGILDASIRQLVTSRLDRPRLTLYGGEPLLAVPLIRRALDRVRSWAPRRMKPDVRLFTNGTRLDEETVRLLVKQDVFITLSHDGVSPAQDDRGPGTFELLDRLLLRLRRAHPKHFRTRLAVKTTLTSRNVRHLAGSFRYFLSRGVREIDVVPVLPDDPGWNGRSSRLLGHELAEIGAISLAEYRSSGEIPFGPFRPQHPTPAGDGRPTCGCGSRGLLFVDVEGTLAPCVALVRSTLDSPRYAIHRVAEVLGVLHVTDPDLLSALVRRETLALRSPLLGARPRRGSAKRCNHCPARSTCFFCPIAVAGNGGRMPKVQCDANRLFAHHGDAFRRWVAMQPPLNSSHHGRQTPATSRIRDTTPSF